MAVSISSKWSSVSRLYPYLYAHRGRLALGFVADLGYVLQQGHIVLIDTSKNLRDNDLVRRAYLGG